MCDSLAAPKLGLKVRELSPPLSATVPVTAGARGRGLRCVAALRRHRNTADTTAACRNEIKCKPPITLSEHTATPNCNPKLE